MRLDMQNLVWAKEHEYIEKWKVPDRDYMFHSGVEFMSNLRLGLDFRVGYFIGVDWLIEGGSALAVEPKVKNLDYLTMFLECFDHPDSSNAINQSMRRESKVYDIDFDSRLIDLEGKEFQITHLIIIHFIKLLQSIVRKGLKKGYVSVTHEVRGGVKGKILIGDTIKSHIKSKNTSRTHCKYDVFTVNCLENKILKKALLFTQSYLINSGVKLELLKPIVNYCAGALDQVDSKGV